MISKPLIPTTQSKPSSYAWLVFFLSACFLFYKYILQISPAVMTTELMQTYALTGTTLGFLVGFYFYTYLIMQIPSGILLDRFGAHKLTSSAIFLCALGTLIFSQTHSFAIACFARLLIGFGAAFATTSYMKLSSIWFPVQYFALLSGLFGTACMSGAGTAEAPLAWLLNHISWREVLLCCALTGFILFLLFWFFVQDPCISKNKAEKNNFPDQKFKLADLLHIFLNRSNWPLILYGGLAFTPVSVFGGLWGVPYLMEAYNLPRTLAASSVSLAFFGFAVGGIVVGWIGKQMKEQLPVVVIGTSCALFFLSVVLYFPYLPLWLLHAFIFAFGFSASSFLLSYTIAKNINSAIVVGTVIGVINMGDPLCGGLAEPLIGKILDWNWEGVFVDHARVFSLHAYQLGLSVLTGYLVLALFCCCFIREKRRTQASETLLENTIPKTEV